MILKNIKNKAPKKPKPEPKMLFKPKKGIKMKLYVNVELESWGQVSAFINVVNGILSVKSIELLQGPFIEINNGHSFLEYKNLSSKDVNIIKNRCSYVLNNRLQ